MGAAFKGYRDIAELLIRYGAEIDQQHGNGGTALMFAAMFGRNELVKLLVDNGADIHLVEKNGLSASELALHQNNLKALELLAG